MLRMYIHTATNGCPVVCGIPPTYLRHIEIPDLAREKVSYLFPNSKKSYLFFGFFEEEISKSALWEFAG
jgi:hypothetical protein